MKSWHSSAANSVVVHNIFEEEHHLVDRDTAWPGMLSRCTVQPLGAFLCSTALLSRKQMNCPASFFHSSPPRSMCQSSLREASNED
jgi:hypothetical protein